MNIFSKKTDKEKETKNTGKETPQQQESLPSPGVNKMLATLMENSANLEEKIKKLEEENKQLTEELNQATLSEKEDINNYQSKFQEIFSEFTKWEEKMKSKDEIIAQNDKIVAEKDEVIKSKDIAISKKQEEVVEWMNKWKDVKAIIDDKDKEIDILKKELHYWKHISKDEEIAIREDRITDVINEKDKIEQDLANERIKILNLKKEYDALQSKYKAIESINIVKSEEIYQHEAELEAEWNKIKEELEEWKKNAKENQLRASEVSASWKSGQYEYTKLQKEYDLFKNESNIAFEELKDQFKTVKTSLLSSSQIKELYSEQLNILALKENSLSYLDIVNLSIFHFSTIVKSCFNTAINGDWESSTLFPITWIHDNLKDIYFLLYIRAYEKKIKASSAQSDIRLSSNDFSDDFFQALLNEISSKNIISKYCRSSKEIIDTALKKMIDTGMSTDIINEIKENYLKKYQMNLTWARNTIKSLLEKCINTIKNGRIEIDSILIFDFHWFICDNLSLTKGNWYIDSTKITNVNAEHIMQLIKYSNDKITKIQFVGRFNFEKLSELTLMKVLLIIFTYSPNILSFSLTGCEGTINSNLLLYLLFVIENLKSWKILNLENNAFDDDAIKIICDKLKDNVTIVALFLNKNKITSTGGMYIGKYLATNRSIIKLYLGNNNITDTGLTSILEIITSTNLKITTLDLSYNNFTFEDFKTLSHFLVKNPNISSLSINGNWWGDMPSSVILGAGWAKVTKIKVLNLSNMNIIADSSPVLFKDLNLEELYLDDNNIEEIGFIILCKAMLCCNTLKKLSLKNTKICAIGLTHLLDLISKNANIKEVHLESNDLEVGACEIWKKTKICNDCTVFIKKQNIKGEGYYDSFKQIDNLIIL